MTYVSGFVAPVKIAKKDEYLAMARQAWAIFRDYGALETRECWGTDLSEGEITSFPRAVQREEDETVVMSWILWPDKPTSEACYASFETDPRWGELDMAASGADMKRMFFAGFESAFHKTA